MENGKMAAKVARSGEIEWQRRVLDWENSDKSQVAWCLEHNISIKTFERWKARFSRKSKNSCSSSPSIRGDAQPLIPLRLTDDVPNAMRLIVRDRQLLSVGIDRFSVKVSPDFDALSLKRLLATLSEIA